MACEGPHAPPQCTMQAGPNPNPNPNPTPNPHPEPHQAGQFFGERTLLKDEPANATVKTVAGQGAVTCYVCSRGAFTAILGPLQALIDAD